MRSPVLAGCSTTAVYIVRRRISPDWSTGQDFDTNEHHLIINYYHQGSGLLFICSSLRVEGLYGYIGQQYTNVIPGAYPREPSVKSLNRVLLDLQNTRFFNIGMRKSVVGDNSEAYRTIAGSNADHAIDHVDGRAFTRGHWYGTAQSGEDGITIGLSSSAKVWSNKSSQIPGLIEWCELMAQKMSSDRTPRTNSGLDLLSTGEELSHIPDNVVFADWHEDTYLQPVTVHYVNRAGEDATGELLDFDLAIDFENTSVEKVTFVISNSEMEYQAMFAINADKYIHSSPANPTEMITDESPMTMEEYLNYHPPTFYTSDFASFYQATYFPPADTDGPEFSLEQFEVVDWSELGVDVRREFGDASANGCSIHEYLRKRLVDSDANAVFYDHGSGEIADFVTFDWREEIVRVSMYHCKAFKAAKAGERPTDSYEVCGQAAKGLRWSIPGKVLSTVERRLKRKSKGSRFDKGEFEELKQVLGPGSRRIVVFEAVIVQPGLSRASLGTKVGPLLAAADGFLFDSGRFTRLRVIGSE